MAAKNSILTQQRLQQLYDYDSETGIFFHKTNGTKRGFIRKDGYVQLEIDRHYYLCHRLAWLYVNGEWPKHEIDHINKIKSDNRITNLRDVRRYINSQNKNLPKNNKSGHTGIKWETKSNKWIVKFQMDNKIYHLGTYEDLDKAIQVKEAKVKEILYNDCNQLKG